MMGLCVSDVAFHILVISVAAHDQEAAAAQDMLPHIQTKLMFTGVVLMEKDGLVSLGADGVIPSFKQRSGIGVTLFVEIHAAAPGGGDVSKR